MPKRVHGASFKAKVAIEVIKGEKPVAGRPSYNGSWMMLTGSWVRRRSNWTGPKI